MWQRGRAQLPRGMREGQLGACQRQCVHALDQHEDRGGKQHVQRVALEMTAARERGKQARLRFLCAVLGLPRGHNTSS